MSPTSNYNALRSSSLSWIPDHYQNNDEKHLTTDLTIDSFSLSINHFNTITPKKQTTSSNEMFPDILSVTSSIDYLTLKCNKDDLSPKKSTGSNKHRISDDINIAKDIDDENVHAVFDFLTSANHGNEHISYKKYRKLTKESKFNHYNYQHDTIDNNKKLDIERIRIDRQYDAIEDEKHDQFDHNIEMIAFIHCFEEECYTNNYTTTTFLHKKKNQT